MKYRKEIDGLRAIAVLPVILFHAGFEAFSGGFVGVDIFFVISGYLITSIIISDLEQQRFSILEFYERRARRILPALFIVVLVCLPAAWLLLLPSEMIDFSQSLISVPLFGSNILFWQESGYFDTSSELKPLLHTWSLAVEEQYYVLFPLALMMIWRFPKAIVVLLLFAAFCVSLWVSEWAAETSPAAAFYLLPSRAWELLIGVFAALYLSRKGAAAVPHATSELASWVGILLIVYSVIVFDKSTAFPGLNALAPTIGTVLIILFATPATFSGRLLGNRLLVGVGLISYSAYLWHQPLFAFARQSSLHEPSEWIFSVLALITLLLAYLTWRYVEAPFRNKKNFSRRQIFTFSIVVSLAVVFIGGIGFTQNGFESRFSREVVNLENPAKGTLTRCDDSGARGYCMLGDGSESPSMAMIGDSHSRVLRAELSRELEQRQLTGISYEGSWCVPLLDVGTDHNSKNPQCRGFIVGALKSIIEAENIKDVVLVAQWSNYTQGFRWNDVGVAYYADKSSREMSVEENSRVVARGLERTVRALKAAGKEITLVMSVPEYQAHIPTLLAKTLHKTGELDIGSIGINRVEYMKRNQEFIDIVEQLDIRSEVNLIETVDIFCPIDQCVYGTVSGSYYTDSNHLSLLGSKVLVPHIVQAIVSE